MSDTGAVTGRLAGQLETPFVVRGNVWLMIGAIIVGPLLMAAPFLLFAGDSLQDLYPNMAGTAVVMALITVPWTRRFVIDSDEVRTTWLFNMTRRRYRIAGLDDLVIDGKILRRRSDGKKLCKLDAVECNPQDLRTLRASIPAA